VRRGELSYCLFTSGEPSQHRAPGAVAEGSEDTVEAVGLFNHEVEYIGCYVSVNRLVELYPAEFLAFDERRVIVRDTAIRGCRGFARSQEICYTGV
jgi:hypothetical protein